MSSAQGLRKTLSYKKETTFGVLPTVTGAKLLRRVTGSLDVSKSVIESNEVRNDFQRVDARHSQRQVEGSLAGELSPGAYTDLIASALMRVPTAGATTGVIASMNLNAGTHTATRGAGSYLADGLKIGDVVRATGFTTASNNTRNILISALTATILTYILLDDGTLTTEATATNVTIAVVGKKTFVPLTGHTSDSYTFEEFYSDVPASEVYSGVKIGSVSFSIPPADASTVDFSLMGKDLAQTGVTQFFTSPTALSTFGFFEGSGGALIINGAEAAKVTSVSFSIERNLTMEPTVGNRTVSDIFDGRCIVSGEFTAFFEDVVYRDLFLNETESTLIVALTASSAFNADVVSFVFPRIKINGANKDDGEKGIIRTFPFMALLNAAGGTGTATEATTMSYQDSQAP